MFIVIVIVDDEAQRMKGGPRGNSGKFRDVEVGKQDRGGL